VLTAWITFWLAQRLAAQERPPLLVGCLLLLSLWVSFLRRASRTLRFVNFILINANAIFLSE